LFFLVHFRIYSFKIFEGGGLGAWPPIAPDYAADYAAVVAVVQHHVVAELVEALTCAATTAMRWDTSHATVQQRRSRRQ